MEKFEYVVHRERNRTNHIIYMGNVNGYPAYMDFTSLMISAKDGDRNKGYGESGPKCGIEVQRAKEYAQYAGDYITNENLMRFNTVQRDRKGQIMLNKKQEPMRGYSFFFDMSAEPLVEAEVPA